MTTTLEGQDEGNHYTEDGAVIADWYGNGEDPVMNSPIGFYPGDGVFDLILAGHKHNKLAVPMDVLTSRIGSAGVKRMVDFSMENW